MEGRKERGKEGREEGKKDWEGFLFLSLFLSLSLSLPPSLPPTLSPTANLTNYGCWRSLSYKSIWMFVCYINCETQCVEFLTEWMTYTQPSPCLCIHRTQNLQLGPEPMLVLSYHSEHGRPWNWSQSSILGNIFSKISWHPQLAAGISWGPRLHPDHLQGFLTEP